MENRANIAPENLVYQKPKLILEKTMHYCPGCSHGTMHKVIAEVIDEMNMIENTVGVSPVGCSVTAYDYMDIDFVQAAHGRAPAIATALKRLSPDKMIFTYQGDGDLSAIGTAEFIHACNRGENIVIIFINNAIYGMTGGQMAPTTPLGFKTATCPQGREASIHGFPCKVTNMVKDLEGVSYITRQSVHTPAAYRKTKKALRKAFENSMSGNGLSIVEVIATCSSGWKLTPVKSNDYMVENIFPNTVLGDIKDIKITF